MSIALTRRRAILSATAAFAFSGVASAAIVLPASADAGLREDQPETSQGTTTSTELTVRVTGSQNRHSLIRFDLTGLTAADLAGSADLQLTYQRNGVTGGTNAGGIKIYGLNPANPLNGTWNEATVQYRDAGIHGDVSPSPTAQPAPGALPAAPVAPIFITSPNDYGALVTGNNPGQNANGAPGVRHETAPYSPNVNNLNVTAYNNNLAVFSAGTGSYAAYTNQPGYTTTTASGAFSDLITAGFDRPLATVGADLIDYSLLGFINYDARATARLGGDSLFFTTNGDNSPVNFPASMQSANNAALVAFLTNLLNNGYTSATFMIVEKNAIDGDALPLRSDNLIYASKEFVPAGGVAGQWAPKLILNVPEPTTAAVLSIGLAGVLCRRRRG